MDAREILWGDAGLYRARYEKTATALIAVRNKLQERRPLSGAEDEFLALYPVLEAADPEIFTKVWEDPFSYFWTRHAYELLALCFKPAAPSYDLRRYCEAIGAHDPRAALKLHLEEFKKFIIALELLRDGMRRFTRPWRATLPISIPGTPFSIVGRGPCEILAIAGGAIEVAECGRTRWLKADASPAESEPAQMIRRPSLEHDGVAVNLKPETFILPGVAQAEALSAVAQDFQPTQLPLIRAALALVGRHQPETLRAFGELIKVIALKPPKIGDFSNVSRSDLPGAFILSTFQDPYWIADSLIHEFFHNRLFFIADQEPIFAMSEPDQDPDQPGEFYSPWRMDLRPLSGLLHALYVYLGVGKFWFSVWQSGETSGARRAYAEDQTLRWMAALRIGVHQLRTRGNFTEFGARLFAEISREVDSLCAGRNTAGLSLGAPAMLLRPDGEIVPYGVDGAGRPLSILASIRHHQLQYDILGQCSDLVSILDR